MAVTSALHFYRQTCIQFDVQAAFAEYEKKTTRQIPVIVLTRLD